MSALNSISPIDGRYSNASADLVAYFSEHALMRYRVIVEGEYLIALSENKQTQLRKFTDREKIVIRQLYAIGTKDVEAIKKIETATNHDVKAVEYFIKERFSKTSLRDVTEWIHFALTSEDTNNIAYALMISEALRDVMMPSLQSIINTINMLAKTYKATPMLARTHGQSASGTTLGKEFKVFSVRLKRQFDQLAHYRTLVKMNGATGNYNAHVVAYPNVDWMKFTTMFINNINQGRKLHVEANLVTTQIEPHDTYAELFDIMRRINTILLDFNQDIWRYISDHWIIQKSNAQEIGSSTMPHKVNPIDFENSEGNLGLANALFTHFSTKLPISRLQRDLSDSTVLRNIGVAFAYSLIGYKSTLKGLAKISADTTQMTKDLSEHEETIAEGIQTILRREGMELPYEKLKQLTRDKKVSKKDFDEFIDDLSVKEKIKNELKKITPSNYIGLATKLAE